MGLVNKVKLSEIAQEKSLRFDVSFIKFFASQKQEYYGYKDLFCIPAVNNVNLSEIEELKYAEISNINKEGEVYPVHLCFDNKNEENESYFAKIERGDIFKPQINSILLSSVRPYLNKNVLITDDELYFTKAMIQIKPKINPKLFYYCIRSVFFDLINAVSRQGKGYPTLKADDLKNIKFPKTLVDSILRQENMLVSNIEFIEQEIQKLKKNKKLHLEIINEVFAEEFNYDKNLWREFGKGMGANTQNSNIRLVQIYAIKFSDIDKSLNLRFSCRFHNPLSQQCENILHAQNTIKIKDILAKEIRRGINPQYDENGEIAVVKTAQLKNSVIDLECCEFVNKKFFSQKQNAKINKNDIVIASTGKVSIGKIDIWEDEEKKVLADAHISIVTINEKLYNPLFLVYFLRSILGAYQIERDYTGTTNQVELYANEISNFDILNISLEQQQAIAQKIKAQIDNQNFIDEQIKQKQQEISHLIISVLA